MSVAVADPRPPASAVSAGVLSPTPVRVALADSAAALGPVAARLVDVLLTDYPRALAQRPAAVVRAAGAHPGDLDALLAGAGVLDLDEVRRRAAVETGVRVGRGDLRITVRGESDRPGDARGLLGRLLEREQRNLAHTVEGLQRSGALELAAAAVLAARRRFVLGDQKSSGYAALFATDLSASLARVTSVPPSTRGVLDALVDVRAGDVLVAFCFRRYSRLTLAAAAQFRTAGGTVVGVSDSADGPLAEHCEHLLVVDTASEAPTDSPTTVVAVGHSLAALVSAGAKGAGKRLERRRALAHVFEVYDSDTNTARPSTVHPDTAHADEEGLTP